MSEFPPVPKWAPSFAQPLDKVVDRISYYTDKRRDFAVYRNGTCVILPDGQTDSEVHSFANNVLNEILNFHPDMNPTPMDDGNILVLYNHPAANVVIRDIAMDHWNEIETHHLDGLAPSEVLLTPLGPNKFDEFGMLALLGRAYMFMDAKSPEIIQIERH